MVSLYAKEMVVAKGPQIASFSMEATHQEKLFQD
jgi:hypothetical protein